MKTVIEALKMAGAVLLVAMTCMAIGAYVLSQIFEGMKH